MPGRGDWRGPPIPAQLAFRVTVLGGVALVMFAIIFLRLWYLEVLSGDQYLAEAQNNQVREFTVQAPRGEILDRSGRPLVREPDRARAAAQDDRVAARSGAPSAAVQAGR